jgi:hypothetical protein
MGVGLRSTISRETTTSPQFAMRLQCHDPKVPSKPLRVDGGEGRGLSPQEPESTQPEPDGLAVASGFDRASGPVDPPL